jgi:hypothetical protein
MRVIINNVLCVCMYVGRYVIHICIYVRKCICVCMHIHIFMYIRVHRDQLILTEVAKVTEECFLLGCYTVWLL